MRNIISLFAVTASVWRYGWSARNEREKLSLRPEIDEMKRETTHSERIFIHSDKFTKVFSCFFILHLFGIVHTKRQRTKSSGGVSQWSRRKNGGERMRHHTKHFAFFYMWKMTIFHRAIIVVHNFCLLYERLIPYFSKYFIFFEAEAKSKRKNSFLDFHSMMT